MQLIDRDPLIAHLERIEQASSIKLRDIELDDLGLKPVMSVCDIRALLILGCRTIDAIPVDWLENRLNDTAEAIAQGRDESELNNAIFTVLVEWEKHKKNSNFDGTT